VRGTEAVIDAAAHDIGRQVGSGAVRENLFGSSVASSAAAELSWRMLSTKGEGANATARPANKNPGHEARGFRHEK